MYKLQSPARQTILLFRSAAGRQLTDSTYTQARRLATASAKLASWCWCWCAHAMAASLGLNPEALFTSYYSSPFMSDYAASFPPSAVDSAATAFSAELLDDLHHFEYSPASIFPGAGAGAGAGGDRDDKMMWCEGGGDEKRLRSSGRIGFRTRSEVEILDDGFKWRKYGKKAVKNSPNPRNYYRCSSEGCGVKKRVERDRDDPRYVITTYDGVHNHASPGAAAIIQYGGGGGGFYSPPHTHSGSPSAASYSGSFVF